MPRQTDCCKPAAEMDRIHFTLLSTRQYKTCDWLVRWYLQHVSRRLPCGDDMPVSHELGQPPMSSGKATSVEVRCKKDEHAREKTKAHR